MRSGFSLVELSIVLVILGLLAGGVLTGQSLIRAAELRSVTTEFSKYQAAVNTFRDKYFALPGDMTNAVKFWGVQAGATTDGVDTTCAALLAAATGMATCNGDGDGMVDAATTAIEQDSYESFRFWQHLANAGLIEGAYAGVSSSGAGPVTTIGVNTPRSRIGNAGWTIWANAAANLGNGDMYALEYGNHMQFGIQASGGVTAWPALKPEEAWNIDSKIDDGKPARGNVIARYWNNLCAAADDGTHANNDLAASYRLTDSSIQCALFFVKAF